MNIQKIKITEDQKKIIILSGIGLLVFLLLWVFLYLPASKEIKNLRSALTLTEGQIQGIEAFLGGVENRDEAIRLLKQKEQDLSKKFPQKEQEGLRDISDLARKDNIVVVSLQPGSMAEFADEAGQKVVIEGKAAYYLPVSMEINCSYKDLVKYFLDLKAHLPMFASVNSLNIRKDSQVTGKVHVSISFNLYLLVENA